MTQPVFRKYLLTIPIASAALLGGSADAQEADPTIAPILGGQITLFSGSSFKGASFVVTGPRTILTIPYKVQSVMIPTGHSWELCSQPSYRSCKTYNGPVRNVSLFVLSARPAKAQIQPPIALPSQSLRGMTSEYFPAPTNQQGGRVPVPNGTAAAAADRADGFCRRVGWNGSAYQRLQTVSGHVYLADVLCVRSGF